ncbi:glycoside hydrolase family 2 protein [Coniophora puteana RWD-64-598 SS2]|uniref:Beta-mannosidase A n=1 Tax=Coniophora puteana (strain RWD-64-598) TaxID=741705 RepID=A0A5M3MWG6_CONPW|nr:glycoside hydrolase family 2 protein [Coniophora puteana RWD-64-598 SS2]EIW83456.1 glycoside hydrolase family 2 protein [Coniophora puteana RWD-64-598 SS2]
MTWLRTTLLAFSLSAPALGQVFDLSQLSWTLKNQNGSIAIPGSLPSQAHLDLLKAGIITEPLLGINDYTQRWIIYDNWTYTADLSSVINGQSTNSGSSDTTLLVFYGIDTVANITFAGHPVAWVDNQFKRYVFDVSGYLESPAGDDKNLTIALESAWYYGLNVTSRPDAEYFPNNANATTSDDYEVPSVRQWIRKIDDDFGWDWGPAFVPTGVHKPAYLVTLANASNPTSPSTPTPEQPFPSTPGTGSPYIGETIFLDETSVDIYKVGQNGTAPPDESADWVLNVTFGLRSTTAYQNPTVTLSLPELELTSQPLDLDAIPAQVGDVTYRSVNWTIPDAKPERWYPADLGTPKLYNLTVTFTLSGSSSSSSSDNATTLTQTIRTGFRTIFLAQTAYSDTDIAQRGITPGDQWHFAINGQPFYAKGTNIIPFDPFYSRISPAKARWVLESAVASGQNMLRVWGGGAYQPSDAQTDGGVYDFYSACDELGILAWSELIFSDTLYPINDWYLENVEGEVRQNVRRVNRHPSNVQWAGGNEIEGIVMQANTSLANGTHYLDEFVALFQDYLHDIVVSETKSVPYTDCSTTHGVLSLDPYVLRFANGTEGYIYGNSERYNYDPTQAFNLSTYPVSRFVNEFGFHSLPSFYSWEEVLESPDDFSLNSTVVMSRDHHPPAGNLSFPNPNAPQGQYQMSSAVELWLPTPNTSDSNQTFAQWCYSTQVFQSMNMIAEIAWYRRGAGLGENNLGSLVWQLNDIWQGVSWSAIEYSGRWKVLNYGLAGVYAPVIVSPFWFPENETLTVLATSDRWESVNASAQMTWYDWSGKVLNSTTRSVEIPSLNNSLVFEGTGLSSILPQGANASDVWLLLNVTATVDNKTVTNEQYFTPASLADAKLVDPQISMTSSSNLTFTLSAKGGVAPWTWIDHPAGTVGYFVDAATERPSNGFYLIPGLDRTLQFMMSKETSSNSIPEPSDFVVRSLWNNTHA